MPTVNFTDDRHALFAGYVLGVAMRHGIPLEPVADERGDWTPMLRLELPEIVADGTVELVFVVPPPAPDWRFPHELVGSSRP